jgi:hypothetical protein
MSADDGLRVRITNAMMGIGIYPLSNCGVDRTAWQDGWNAGVMDVSNKVMVICGENEADAQLTYMLDDELLWCHDGKYRVNLSDTFFYACADAEEVGEGDMDTVLRLHGKYGRAGLVFWAAERRGYDPEIPRYQRTVAAIRALEAVPV